MSNKDILYSTGKYSHYFIYIVLGRSPGEGKGYPLQYSGLENSMDWGHKQLEMTEWVVTG